MRKLINVVWLILAIVVFALGYRFAADNSTPISLTWFGREASELPTFLWLIAALGIGVVLGFIGFLGKNISLRLKLNQARSELKRRNANQNRIVPDQLSE